MTAWGEIDVPEDIMRNGDILDPKAATEKIRRLIKEHRGVLRGKGVVASLPEAKTFIKIITVPARTSDQDLKKEILKEIEQNIPLSADEIYFDWQTLGPRQDPAVQEVPKEPGEKGLGKDGDGTIGVDGKKHEARSDADPEDAGPSAPPTEKSRILVGAAPKRLVDKYTDMLEAADLVPIALEIEATAISRSLMPIATMPTEPVGIIDIGATRSSLVIHDGGVIQMSVSIPISGIDITQTISEALKVSMQDAEALKKECGLDVNRCEDKMWKILLPLIDDMADKIRNALRFYGVGFPEGRRIELLYLCGGGAHFREIDTVLSKKLAIKVERGNALTNIGDSTPRNYPKDLSLTHTTAIGLALRAATEHVKKPHRSR
jgi:Tfp pilus assembly PilM family ATPase